MPREICPKKWRCARTFHEKTDIVDSPSRLSDSSRGMVNTVADNGDAISGGNRRASTSFRCDSGGNLREDINSDDLTTNPALTMESSGRALG